MSFSSLGLSPRVCTPLARLGYATPTPVQSQSIPIVLEGRDMLARAQTGTGKTAAFALPMIDRLLVHNPRQAQSRQPRGLVLVPTRELALQVHKAIDTYGSLARLRTVAIFGGVPMRAQTQALQRGTDIVVATPGRLIDHMEHRTVDLSAVEILTLDEADRMLDMGFLPALRRVLAALPQARQTLLFSATLSEDVVRLSSAFTREPVRVDVTDGRVVAPTVTHRIHPVADSRKPDLLTHVLTQAPIGQALVFCKTKHGSNRVGKRLERAGVKAAVIHGNKSQGARNRALGDFKAGRVTVLVATDIAARGLDIAQLPLVVNYDLPLVAADYIHRIGRTGRAGLAGRAVSLFSPGERALLHDIQRLLPEPLEQVVVKGFEVRAGSEDALPKPSRRRTAPQSRRFVRRESDRRLRTIASIGCATATQVEHGPGCERVLLRDEPRDHRRNFFDEHEAASRDLRQHVVDVRLRALLENTRVCRCGCDAVHRDVMTRQLLAEGLGQRDDAGLRRAVGGRRRVSFLPSDRRDVHDAAILLLQHVWHDGAATEKNAGQVDVDHLLPGVYGVLPDERVRPGDAGIRYQDVDTAEGAERDARRGVNVCLSRHVYHGVTRDAPVLRELGRNRLDELFIAIPERHVRARLQEALGDGAADALAAPGNYGMPSCQIDLIHRSRIMARSRHET